MVICYALLFSSPLVSINRYGHFICEFIVGFTGHMLCPNKKGKTEKLKVESKIQNAESYFHFFSYF